MPIPIQIRGSAHQSMRRQTWKKYFYAGIILPLISAIASTTPGISARAVQSSQVVTVSAADFQARIAPDSIVATFGAGLSTTTLAAESLPLPTELGGTTVTVRDSQGRDFAAPLLFVSPAQINHIIPADAVPGAAQITVRSGNGSVVSGAIQIASVAPAIFTANQDGRGAPAATALRLAADGEQTSEPVETFADGRFIPRPINLGPDDERVFLILFLSGLRRTPNTDGNNDNGSAENVSVLIGGVLQAPLFAGAQGSFAGLDQVNVEIPRQLLDATLPGSKQINISVQVSGFSGSNEVEIALAPPTAPPLEVTGFNAPAQLLANSGIQILGSGLDPEAANNRVSFGEGTGDVRPGEVRTASSSDLSVIVPFGAVSGRIALNSDGRRWTSDQELQVRTSFSAQIKDTEGQPLSSVLGARVCAPDCTGNNPSTNIQTGGWFVLPDPLPGARRVFSIEPPQTAGALPFNRITVASQVIAGRDNHLPQEIYIQTIYGPSGTIGSSFAGNSPPGNTAAAGASTSTVKQTAQGNAFSLAIEGFRFTLPAGATAMFPNGATNGQVTLTPVKNSLTPVPMPPNVFSSAVVQISPFGVKLAPGGKLFFPNRDGFGTQVIPTLYKYDLESAAFIDTGIRVTIGDQGVLETPDGAITETSIYFLAVRRESTTIVGRVFDGDGRTPVRGAVVSTRGQQAVTDGNGGYILSSVPVGDSADIGPFGGANAGANAGARPAAPAQDQVIVTSSYLRPSGKTDIRSVTVDNIDIGGVTQAPAIVLPPAASNRPPVIYAPGHLTLYSDEMLEATVTVDDPDPNQTIASATVTGASFASLAAAGSGSYTLRLAPTPADTGTHMLTITAADSAGASASFQATIIVFPPPAANALAVSTNEDTPLAIVLPGSGGNGSPLVFTIVEAPMHGVLAGAPPNLVYTPNQDYIGADGFRFQTSDGTRTSAPATVTITINDVNDPPQLTVTCSVQGNITTGTPITCQVSASDPDVGQFLLISADNLPAGATFDPDTGLFAWTPGPDQAGSHSVTFKVIDSGTPPLTDLKTVGFFVFNAQPVITSLQPAMATILQEPMILTVTGQGFVLGSEVRWNGSPRDTSFLGTTQLHALIQPDDLTTIGTVVVTVFNPGPGGGLSAAVNYSIVNPVPTIAGFLSVTPPFNFMFFESGMLLVGTGFVPGSVARWDGVDRPTSYVSPTQLGISIPMVPVAEALNTHSITVFNPGPGGGESNALTGFSVSNNPGTIFFTDPESVDAGSGEFQLTIFGGGFVPGATANWNGSPRPTGPVSLAFGGAGTQLTVTISAEDVAEGGFGMLTVTNPPPFDNTSAPFAFPVNLPQPVLTTAEPPSVPEFQYLFTEEEISLGGAGFTPQSVVRWDGDDRPTTYISSAQLTFTAPIIPVLEALSFHDIRVFNPLPGGGLSDPLFFLPLSNTPPSISMVTPGSATAGGPGFELTVTGSYFAPGAVLNWNGSPRPTTVSSSTELTATISAADIMTAGMASLTVLNPVPLATISTIFPFTIHPQPTISALGPDSVTLTIPSQELEIWVFGANFLPQTVIHFDGSPVPTTYLDDMTMSFVRPPITDSQAGFYNVTAVNPAPVTPSSPVVFTVFNPGTLIDNLDPMFADLGGPAFTLAVSGNGFVQESVVRWNGSDRPTTYFSKNFLEAEIPAEDLSSPGFVGITVFNPAPGGGESMPADFFISAPFTFTGSEPAAAGLPGGEVLLAGGRDENSHTPIARVEIFSPATGILQAASPMFAPRAGHTATALATGEVLVIGGLGASDERQTAAQSAEIYDPSTGAWRRASAPNFAHISHTATLMADGRVLVAGGMDETLALSRRAEIYDPASDVWTEAVALTTQRASAKALLLDDGRVLVAGGAGEGGDLAGVEIYDAQADAWTQASDMNLARSGHTLTLIPGGGVLAVGGKQQDAAAVAEIYDPAANAWEASGRLTVARSAHSATPLANGRVLVAGGRGVDGRLLDECEVYDPQKAAWSEAPRLKEPRERHTAVVLSDGRVAAVGGRREKKER
ncbi:MAG: putative Ig domain-containing protein [Blastocatellales bacterium]|nr:putative Ig domain-containing protein [Blastocatellales bacterium]